MQVDPVSGVSTGSCNLVIFLTWEKDGLTFFPRVLSFVTFLCVSDILQTCCEGTKTVVKIGDKIRKIIQCKWVAVTSVSCSWPHPSCISHVRRRRGGMLFNGLVIMRRQKEKENAVAEAASSMVTVAMVTAAGQALEFYVRC